jgi:hypothetical protein
MNNEPVKGDLKTESGFDWVFDGNNWLKIMNNEPVAWMNPETLECGHGGNVDWEDTGCIPLYTHPHPDNLGLAESIIKQQQIEIEALKKQNADMNRRLLGWDIYEQ